MGLGVGGVKQAVVLEPGRILGWTSGGDGSMELFVKATHIPASKQGLQVLQAQLLVCALVFICICGICLILLRSDSFW